MKLSTLSGGMLEAIILVDDNRSIMHTEMVPERQHEHKELGRAAAMRRAKEASF